MLYIPKNTKFTKFQKKKIKNSASKFLTLNYGSFGLRTKENSILTSKQIEMLNLNLTKGTKKTGRY
jgi:ribosomal protein L16/L10AE